MMSCVVVLGLKKKKKKEVEHTGVDYFFFRINNGFICLDYLLLLLIL